MSGKKGPPPGQGPSSRRRQVESPQGRGQQGPPPPENFNQQQHQRTPAQGSQGADQQQQTGRESRGFWGSLNNFAEELTEGSQGADTEGQDTLGVKKGEGTDVEEPQKRELEEGEIAGEEKLATVEELLAEEAAFIPLVNLSENQVDESSAWEVVGGEAKEEEEDSDEGGTKKIYANEYILSLGPVRTFSFLLGRFPFTYTKSREGNFEFFFVSSSLFGLFFVITSIFHFILLIIVSINLFGILLNVPRQVHGNRASEYKNETGGPWEIRAEELFIFHRNAASFIIFFASLIHICVGNVHFLVKSDFIASYFTFWTEALQITKLHAANGVFGAMSAIVFVQILFIAGYTVLAFVRLAPVTSGAPGLLVMLIFRIGIRDIHGTAIFPYLRYISAFIFFYILICGKIYVFLFLFKCKLIRNAFSDWNHRLDIVLNRSDDYIVRGNRLGKRTGFRELFQDHVVLLDLIEGADVMFSETIESFFTCEVGSFCFQLYYVFRSLTAEAEEFQQSRKLDAIFIGVYLLNSIIIISLLASAVSSVSTETTDGLEIIRRKGFFGRKSPEELYFLLSLYTSYNGHFETAVSGSGYYTLNKEFLLSIGGSFLVYMVILLQFSPPLRLTDDELEPQIPDPSELIKGVENTKEISINFKVGYMKMQGYYNYSLLGESAAEWPSFDI